MSAIHIGPSDDGLATTQRAEIHVGLSDETLAALAVRSAPQVPAQRAGSAYEQVVLNPDDDNLADLGDFADIPQLGSFVRELLNAAPQTQTPQTGRPGGTQ